MQQKSFKKSIGELIREGEMMKSIVEQTEAALDQNPVTEDKPVATTAAAPIAEPAPQIVVPEPKAGNETKGIIVALPKDMHMKFTMLALQMGITKKELAMYAIKKLLEEKGM